MRSLGALNQSILTDFKDFKDRFPDNFTECQSTLNMTPIICNARVERMSWHHFIVIVRRQRFRYAPSIHYTQVSSSLDFQLMTVIVSLHTSTTI